MSHTLNHPRRIKFAVNEMLDASEKEISGRTADIALVNCNYCNLNLELSEFLIARARSCRSGSCFDRDEEKRHISSYQYHGIRDGVSRSINDISSKDGSKTRTSYLTCALSYLLIVATIFALLTPHAQAHESISDVSNNNVQHLSEIEDFTFYKNGSFLQIDAGKEWPFNSKREISFRFKTKSPHGLLVYQTFDHNKLHREEDQENLEIIPQPTNDQIGNKLGTIKANILAAVKKSARKDTMGESERESTRIIRRTRSHHQQQQIQMAQLDRPSETELNVRHLSRIDANIAHDPNRLNEPLSQLGPGTITATASEKLVNSLFSSSHISTINGNSLNRNPLLQASPRDKNVLVAAIGANGISSRDSIASNRNRLLNGIVSGISADDPSGRLSFGTRSKAESSDGSPVLSSSTINSFSASLYELYIKLENGRLKIVYEFGSRLNQTFCGKSLNDDRWHRVDLKVDPEINQMVLTLDQMINVEIALSPVLHEDDSTRRNELVFTNSILYLGGLNNNASIVKNIRQRLYMAQFIGCLGQIMLKTDQSTESTLQPAPLDKAVMVKRGCSNLCNTDNYCLHKSTCVNYYTNTRCDCFGTNYEDDYCWQDKLTSLSMLGYSTLVYRIYDWRDRHHSNNNRFSIQFKTLARDSVLFFAYGDLSAQQALKNPINFHQNPGSGNIMNLGFPVTQVNISNLATIHRPQSHQVPSNNNYLAISLANGSLIVEISFGDQPVLLSNLLYDRIENLTTSNLTFAPEHNDHLATNQMNLADGKWHNVTLIHNGKQLSLHLDGFAVIYTILGKNNHLYFDPSIYIGGVPNFLLNETRALLKPVNLRYKFVGCMRSVYFNQQNILLDLKRGSQMVEYRDPVGKPLLNTCEVTNPNLLPVTLRSGKSYLTFQLSSSPQAPGLPNPWSMANEVNSKLIVNDESKRSQASERQNLILSKKRTLIEFEYKTTLTKHFLAGGHLRDLSYHDLGGFWTLQARDECQLTFTISSGLTFDPEQVLVLSTNRKRCEQNQWYKVAISIMSGDKVLNITRNLVEREDQPDHGSYTISSSVELLHQVQIGGDLAKFDESSPIPFSGCIRHIIINGHSFDSRDFVTASTPIIPSVIATNSPQNFTQQNPLLQTTQYDLISSKMAQGYVTIDSCRLVNPCLTQNPCKNGGLCKVSELGEPDCDCSKTGYTGRRCHFSIYKKSCQDLYLSGQRKSSFYLIDLDRNGPMKPIRVRCNMDSGFDHIETSLSHNLPAEYLLRRSSTADIYLDITYLAFHHMYTHDGFYLHDDADDTVRSQQEVMLKTLIGQSTVCKQQFRYECRSAPLNLGNKTWLEAPYPRRHRLISLDGINDGKCSCASSEKRCLDPQRGCNCDSGDPIWSEDSSDFLGNDQVGITRIVLLRREEDDEQGITIDDRLPSRQSSHNVESQSRITLGDLKCYGTVEHGNQHEITFKTSDAYIEVPGWRKGGISFNFRTASNPPAIILYQLATSRNHGYFRLTLASDTRLLFEYIVNRRPRRLSLVASHRLNNGEWQQVFIEYDSANIRLTVNDDSVLVDLDSNDHLGTFEGPLFIGGAPSKYLVGDLSRRNGFTGCFKGLNINGRSIDLNDYLSSAMPTVISGCRPSCTKNLCQNGGKCIEYWGSYECECSNPIAHSGSNCEINLNTNSITFITPESHYVEQTTDSSTYPPYLIKSILLNIRTYQETALVLYAHDQFNNFIQLHKNGSSLVLTFNSNTTIVSARIPIDDETATSLIDVTNQVTPSATISNTYAESQISINQTNSTQNNTIAHYKTTDSTNPATKQQNATQNLPNLELEKFSIRVSNTSGSGQPIQVKIERLRQRTTFFVNNNFVVVERPLVLLTELVHIPWLNPELELVRPIRAKSFNLKTPSRIFLANVDEHFSTRLPGFTGCIQGFSIDNQLFDFNRAHLTGEMKGDYKIGCKMHCDSFPCKNQGTCVENWIEDRIQCKCDATSYIGKICDEDVAAVFNGETSRFIYNINRKLFVDRQASQITARLELERSDEFNGRTNRNSTVESIQNKRLVEAKYILDDQAINLLDVSLAFSSENNQSEPKIPNVQVLVWITQANSSRHFFLGLTSDGGLLIQEDYGNSMSLSRLIKKPEQPFNDGYRHMVRYSRFNQSIQITVDHQTYLPTMSIIAANRISRFSKSSLIIIGNSDSQSIDKMEKPIVRNESPPSPKAKQVSEHEDEYVNYRGCISNLIVRMNGFTMEPLSEAFGQNFETITINATSGTLDSNSRNVRIPIERDAQIPDPKLVSIPSRASAFLDHDQYLLDDHTKNDKLGSSNRELNIIDRVSQRDVRDVMEIMVTQDVEQGKCASFKRTENSNEKRSVNEPKFTQLLDPRPAYMDPPRVKLFDRSSILRQSPGSNKSTKGILFYLSLTFLVMVLGSSVIYAYILQVHYKSEKFRCETPFFHNKREDTPIRATVPDMGPDQGSSEAISSTKSD